MIIIKYIEISLIIFISTIIGILYSKKYVNRVKDLEEIKKGLYIFKSKIEFTYEPIPEVFKDLKKDLNSNIGNIFLTSSNNMNKYDASLSWEKALEEEKAHTSFEKRDIDIILGLSKMLGCTDLEGQINNIDLVCSLLDNQIDEAIILKKKNEKLYKTLGLSMGLAIAIILI